MAKLPERRAVDCFKRCIHIGLIYGPLRHLYCILIRVGV
jgi:hypothetical protein